MSEYVLDKRTRSINLLAAIGQRLADGMKRVSDADSIYGIDYELDLTLGVLKRMSEAAIRTREELGK